MREIKFRAWDKVLKGWIVEKVFFCDGEAYILRGEALVLCYAEIMQYTGLKDKNGKEIYEGDILEDVDYEGDDNFWEVKWVNVSWEAGGYEMDKKYTQKKQKIIGNIYQNKDLIK